VSQKKSIKVTSEMYTGNGGGEWQEKLQMTGLKPTGLKEKQASGEKG